MPPHEKARDRLATIRRALLRVAVGLILIAAGVIAVILILVWMEEGEAESFPSRSQDVVNPAPGPAR